MYPLKIEGALVKEESSYGSDPTPTAGANAIRGVGRLWPAITPEAAFPNMREEELSNSLIGVAPGPSAGQLVNFDWRLPLRGAGAAYSSSTPVRPEADPFLRASGFSRTHVDTGSSESVSYAFADTSHSSAAAYLYAAGKRFVVLGMRGNMTLEGAVGQPAFARFALQGMLAGVTEASVPSMTLTSIIAPVMKGIALTLTPSGQSAWTPKVPGFELTTGHAVDRADDVNAADGVEGFFIGATEPRFSFTPRTKDLTTYDAWVYAQSRLIHTLDATINPSVQYNRLVIDCDDARLLNPPQPAEDGNFAASRMEYMLRHLILRFN